MKCFFKSLLLFIFLIMSGCSSDNDDEITKPDQNIETLLLEWQIICFTPERPSVNIKILSGNSGYVVLQPKKIVVNGDFVDNDRDVIIAYVKNNEVVVEQLKQWNDRIYADLLLIDKKGQKRVILTQPNDSPTMTYLDDESEKRMLQEKFPDYWFIP